MRISRLVSAPVFLCCLLSATLTSTVQASGERPGSIVIYPVHRATSGWFTIINVTNASPTTSTNLHYKYANVIASTMPFLPKDCRVFDRVEMLTPSDTLSVLTHCHNAGFGNSRDGYLTVTALNPSNGQSWSHNWLLGSELVLHTSGIAYSLNALSFPSPVASGRATDVNSNGLSEFDGREYEAIPDFLYIDSFIGLASQRLVLLNLTGMPTDRNSLFFRVYNDNEFPLSTTLTFSCWFDQPLSAVSNLFSDSFLRRLRNDPGELDLTCDGKGDLETGWATIESTGVRHSGGGTVASDGAIVGALVAGPRFPLQGGRLLWRSAATQTNGHLLR